VSATLPDDPRWPRAGGWPAANDLGPEIRIDLGLIGIPAWRTSLSATGAHATPAAVREALRRYSPAVIPQTGSVLAPLVDLGLLSCADFGDVDEPDGPQGERRGIAAVAEATGRARLLVAVGGDNSITVATALGVWGNRLGQAGLVTLDAHYDLRDGVSNGSPVRRLVEAGLDGRRIVQIGIADFANSVEYARRAADYGITVVHRDELHRRPIADVMAEALDIAGAAGGPIHVDLDVDVCDRSVAPGCPAAVPGGIAAWELRAAARAAAADERVRSIDIAEVDATADAPDGRTVRLAALCVLEAAAGLARR
jgi:formiminoglutamase